MKEPLQFFRLFFDESIIDMIASQTNLYARQTMENEVGREIRKDSQAWLDVGREDILSMIGCLTYMGINALPQMSYHWRSTSIYKPTIVAQEFSRDCFQTFYRIYAYQITVRQMIDIPCAKLEYY